VTEIMQRIARLLKWLDRRREVDPLEQAWQDYQLSWDWAHEPPSRDIFLAGYAAGREARAEKQPPLLRRQRPDAAA
jgi:hypothetical protein